MSCVSPRSADSSASTSVARSRSRPNIGRSRTTSRAGADLITTSSPPTRGPDGDALQQQRSTILRLEARIEETWYLVADNDRVLVQQQLLKTAPRYSRYSRKHGRVRRSSAPHLATMVPSQRGYRRRTSGRFALAGVLHQASSPDRIARPASTARSASSWCAVGSFPEGLSRPSPGYCTTWPTRSATTTATPHLPGTQGTGR